jgi:hypothetical protein
MRLPTGWRRSGGNYWVDNHCLIDSSDGENIRSLDDEAEGWMVSTLHDEQCIVSYPVGSDDGGPKMCS